MSTIQNKASHLKTLEEEEPIPPLEQSSRNRTSSLNDLEQFQERERRQSLMIRNKLRRVSSAIVRSRIDESSGEKRPTRGQRPSFSDVAEHVLYTVHERRESCAKRRLSLLSPLPETFHASTQRARAARRSIVQMDTVDFSPKDRKGSGIYPEQTQQLKSRAGSQTEQTIEEQLLHRR